MSTTPVVIPLFMGKARAASSPINHDVTLACGNHPTHATHDLSHDAAFDACRSGRAR